MCRPHAIKDLSTSSETGFCEENWCMLALRGALLGSQIIGSISRPGKPSYKGLVIEDLLAIIKRSLDHALVTPNWAGVPPEIEQPQWLGAFLSTSKTPWCNSWSTLFVFRAFSGYIGQVLIICLCCFRLICHLFAVGVQKLRQWFWGAILLQQTLRILVSYVYIYIRMNVYVQINYAYTYLYVLVCLSVVSHTRTVLAGKLPETVPWIYLCCE